MLRSKTLPSPPGLRVLEEHSRIAVALLILGLVFFLAWVIARRIDRLSVCHFTSSPHPPPAASPR